MIKLIILLTLLMPNAVWALPTSKATLHVVDSSGVPLSGVEARLGFRKPKSSGWGSASNGVKGVTDDNGFYSDSGATEQIMYYGASAEGYYKTSFKYRGFTGVSGILGFRKWQPWNPTLKVVLQKKLNPIPMYAYFANVIDLPNKEQRFQEEAFGYDLVKHDWVSPYGKGITADLMIKMNGYYNNIRDYNTDLLITFSNHEDGLQIFTADEHQGSELKSNHHAPANGYQKSLTQTLINTPSKSYTSSREDIGYYFRIRCTGSDIENCHYGKFYGDISFSPRGKVDFQYYLNPPPGDTNVEFDPARNLFKDLEREIKQP